MPASEKTAEFLAEFHACERRLRAYVRCQVQRIQDAEEVYQEISAVLWTHFDKFQPGSNFFSWACEVARRQVLANHRHRRRMAELIGSELLNQIAVEMLKASESADLRAEALGICLEKLAPYSVHVCARTLLPRQKLGADRRRAELLGFRGAEDAHSEFTRCSMIASSRSCRARRLEDERP